MNDIDFDALDQAVNQQMVGTKKVHDTPKIKVQTRKESKINSRGVAMDIIPNRQLKTKPRKKVEQKTVQKSKKDPLRIRKNNAVSKTIDDIFRTPKDKKTAVKMNQIQRQNRQKNNIIKINNSNIKTSDHKLRERRRLHQPVEINQRISADGGKIIGHYESKTVSTQTKNGKNITYSKDKLDYVADFSEEKTKSLTLKNEKIFDKNSVDSLDASKKHKVIEKVHSKTLKPDESIKKNIEVENKKTTPFLENNKIKKRPLGVSEEHYHSADHQTLKIQDKEEKQTTALYRADNKIAEPEKKTKKNNVFAWALIIITLLGISGLIYWIIFLNK